MDMKKLSFAIKYGLHYICFVLFIMMFTVGVINYSVYDGLPYIILSILYYVFVIQDECD